MRTEVKTIKGHDVLMIEVPDAGVASGVGTVWLDVDQALDLFGRLSGLLPTLSAAAPDLYRAPREPEGDGEDEETVYDWCCPHCGRRLGEDGSLLEHDSHQAQSSCEFDGDNLYVNQLDTERATMAFLCGYCRHVVSVPGEISFDWS